MGRHDIVFRSEDADLSGWFYEPAQPPPWPVVIMTNGFTATRHMATDRYAEVFVRAGLAVLLFDHRGFGDSGGEPRRQINAWIQARGYRDAITFAIGGGRVNPKRIALWGDSFASAVVVAVAAVDDRIRAVVAQVPAMGRTPPPEDPDGTLFRTAKETLLSGDVEASGDDLVGPMLVVSDDQIRRPAALEPLTAYRWFIEYGGRFQSAWVNDVTRANPRTPVPWHAGVFAPHVTVPVLFVASEHDEMPGADPAVARAAFDKLAGPKEWMAVEGGHFGIMYVPSREFDRASRRQAQFLVEHLGLDTSKETR